MPRPSTSRRLTLAYAGLAVVDTWLAGSRHSAAHRARFVTKPLLMPTLAGSLATDARAARSPLRTSTLLAQAGGWGGDVALLGSGTRPFLVGVGSFALGHAAYLAGFWRHRAAAPIVTDPGARLVAGTWLLTAPALAVLAARQHRELGLPVLGYATVLAATTAAAAHLDPALSPAGRRLTAAGAALFLVSDSLLAVRKFVLADPPPALESAVMATYISAQLLLREGASRA